MHLNAFAGLSCKFIFNFFFHLTCYIICVPYFVDKGLRSYRRSSPNKRSSRNNTKQAPLSNKRPLSSW